MNALMTLGRHPFNDLLSQLTDHCNHRRARSSLAFRPPACLEAPAENNTVDDEIVYRQDLGGLLKSYEQRAAQNARRAAVLAYNSE